MRAITQQGMHKDTGQTVRDLAYLRQRFEDAVMTERGELVGARDYGMRLDDLLDRNIDHDFAMRVFARVAEGIQHEANGLTDVQMQSFSLDISKDHTATVAIAARWRRQDTTLHSPLMVTSSARPEGVAHDQHAHTAYYGGATSAPHHSARAARDQHTHAVYYGDTSRAGRDQHTHAVYYGGHTGAPQRAGA